MYIIYEVLLKNARKEHKVNICDKQHKNKNKNFCMQMIAENYKQEGFQQFGFEIGDCWTDSGSGEGVPKSGSPWPSSLDGEGEGTRGTGFKTAGRLVGENFRLDFFVPSLVG